MNKDKSNEQNEQNGQRPTLLICSKCKYNDFSNNVMLEIDFVNCRISYICRQCSHENIMEFKKTPPNLPKIGIQK